MDALVDICWHIYKIKLIDDLHTSDNIKIWGRVNNSLQIIELEKDCSKSRLGEALLHEILHAIDSSIDVELDERKTQILANSLNQLGLGEYLAGKLDLVNR